MRVARVPLLYRRFYVLRRALPRPPIPTGRSGQSSSPFFMQSAPSAWHSALRSALGKRVEAPIAPNPLLIGASLHPYQRSAIEFALAHGGRVLLGHEMGLGKTPMAIAIARHCMGLGRGPVLVVAPPVLLDQWRSEILHWWPEAVQADVQLIRKGSDQPEPDAKFVVVSYAVLSGTKKNPNLHLRSTSLYL